MPTRYKIDVMQALNKAGYNTYRIRKDKVFSQSTLAKFRSGDTTVTIDNIERLCKILNLQYGDILEYVNEESDT